MIIYDDYNHPSLQDYGIEIPISPDKVNKVLEYLRISPLTNEIFSKIVKPIKKISITKKDLLRVHSKDYVEKLYSDSLESELIKVFELIDKNGNYNRYNPANAKYNLTRHFKTLLSKVSGTYQSCTNALKYGFCFFLGGGMHHAKKDYGEGFCLVNDSVIALRKLQALKKIKTAWIIDLDAHKGDGTASLTEGDNTITTLSIHMAKGWPLDKDMYLKDGSLDPSFIPSDIDIGMEENEDFFYNLKLKEGLEKLSAGYEKPDIALVLSGADPYELDELESTKSMKLTLSQLIDRDKMVFEFLNNLNLPKAYIMAGGYGKSSWQVYTQFFEWLFTTGSI